MDLHQSWPKGYNYSYGTYYYDYAYLEYSEPEEHTGLQTFSTLSAVFYSLFVVISLIGNSFLFWVLVKHKGLGSSADLLLLHLTLSDLVFTLALVPWAVFHVRGWIFGEWACKLFSGAIFLGFYSYMMFLTCMTVHRYMMVVYALHSSALDARRRRFYTRLTCAIAWVLSAICSLPEVLFSETINSPEGTLCVLSISLVKVEAALNCAHILIFFLLPFLVITFCYSQILTTIRRCQVKNTEHTVWLIFCIVVGFFVCWAPYNTVIFLETLQFLDVESMLTFAWKEGLAYAFYITNIMAYSHCCLNPLIQIFGGAKFRSYLPSSGGFRRLSERERSHTFSSQNTPYQTAGRQTSM